VAELEAGLIAAGDATGLLSAPSAHYGTAAVAAVERWQLAAGVPVDGTVALGTVVFEPGPVRVGALTVARGDHAVPGDAPFAVTTTARVVTVPLDPNLPTVTAGEAVTIRMPTGAATPGTVASVGPAPPGQSTATTSGSGGGPNANHASTDALVTPADPAATGTGTGVAVQVSLVTATAKNVLAAPIAALLALTGGGYAVEVVARSGTHHLVRVTTGLYGGNDVAVRGAGLVPGTKVVVAG
jgi:hypothetical protein